MLRKSLCLLTICVLLADSARAETNECDTEAASDCERLYGHVEYLMWYLREGRIPPLLTTGLAASAGRLGSADTEVLYGGDRLETRHGDRFFGTRLTAGYWFDQDQSIGLEGRAIFLERDSTYFKAVSDGTTLLARPYVDALTGSPASEILAGSAPGGLRSGGFVGYSRIELFDQEVNVQAALSAGAQWRLDALAGVHFLQMRDRLDVTSTGRSLPDLADLYGLTDHFRADDQFYGGQLGMRGEYNLGPWFLTARGEAALGGTVQTVRAFGDRTFQTPFGKTVQPFGLAVQPSNTGRFTRADLDAVYEVGIDAGCRLTSHIAVFVGYTFIGWNNPIRSGDQVDLVINTGRAGPARPAIPFKEDFLWAQGVNVGLNFSW
jgi:hypothetical protein